MAKMKFDEIRRQINKEKDNPNPYTKNRVEALTNTAVINHGEKAGHEIAREYNRPKRGGGKMFSVGIDIGERAKKKEKNGNS